MENKSIMTGIKSKDRVQQHGEVFTPDSIVNNMVDLVERDLNKEDLDKYIKTTYLEPSCGNGNFLVRILDRKMAAVQKLPKETWIRNMLISLSSIYGIDIQLDNVNQSRARLLRLLKNGEVELLELPGKEIEGWHFTAMGDMITPEIEKNIEFILEKNILHGNALTGYKGSVEQAEQNAVDLMITSYEWDGDNVTMSESAFNSIKNGIDTVTLTFTKNYKDLVSDSVKQGTRNRDRSRRTAPKEIYV